MNGEDTNLALFAASTKVATEVAELRGSLTTSINDLRNELLGPGGRITKIEEHAKDQNRWHNIKTSLLVPVNLVIHVILNHLGWKV